MRQNVFETVYDLATALTYNSSSEPTITAAFISDDPSFPQVVVNPVDVELDDPSFGSTGRNWDRTVRILIDVYTKKRKDLDIITDVLMDELDTYAWSGILFVGSEESTALETPNENKIHLKSIALTFMRR